MTPEQLNTLGETIAQWLIDNDWNCDTRIYIPGKCWNFDSQGQLTILEGLKGSMFFEYANDNLLSMSFEGPFYRAINGYDDFDENIWKASEELSKILEPYNSYWEFGNAWNLSVYPNASD